MTDTFQDLLSTAIDARATGLAAHSAFADVHHRRLVRSISMRRAATGAGVVVAAAALAAGGYGAVAWVASYRSQTPGTEVPAVHPNPVVTSLVREDLGNEEFDFTESYHFYVTLGATEMIPNPPSGYWYPGIPDVPADAYLVSIHGDASGFAVDDADLEWELQLADAREGENKEYRLWFTTLGEVSSETRWAVVVYYVDGVPVTVQEGFSNPEAVQVTAWFDPDAEDAVA